MRDLSAVRQGWGEVERIGADLVCRMTIQESFRHWLQLQQVFEFQLRDTSALFGPERLSALAALQTRLFRLAEWQERHGEPGLLHPDTPTAPAGS